MGKRCRSSNENNGKTQVELLRAWVVLHADRGSSTIARCASDRAPPSRRILIVCTMRLGPRSPAAPHHASSGLAVQKSNSKLVISRPESDSQVTQLGIEGGGGGWKGGGQGGGMS